MPPQPFIDIDSLDMNRLVADQDEIYSLLPHRHEFMRLDRICLLDTDLGVMAGYVDLRDDDFWVRGHIPGRPIFPGVMMIETAAQLVSYYTMKNQEGEGFLGFGGVDGVKFRGSVHPGQRVVMLGRMVEIRKRRCIGETQAFVDGKIVYEGTITGMWI